MIKMEKKRTKASGKRRTVVGDFLVPGCAR